MMPSDEGEEEWLEVKGVQVSSLGRCWNKKTSRPFYPAVHGRYAYVARGRKGLPVHQLVATAFHGARPSPNHTVDHANRITSDNRAVNLRWAVSSEQNKNRASRKNCGGSRPIEIWTVADGWTRYASLREAARMTKINVAALSECLHGRETRNRQITVGCIRYVPVTDVLEGERWDAVDGIAISNLGRIKCRMGIPYFPPNGDPSGYMRTRGRMVHELVALAFVGPRPSPRHTVDHINRVRSDNRAGNLRWATMKQQHENRVVKPIRRCTVPVESIDASGNRVRYASIVEASKATGVGVRGIAPHVCPKTQAAKKTKRKWPLKPGKYRWERVV